MSTPVKVTAPEIMHGKAGVPETYGRDALVKEAVLLEGLQAAVMVP
jgi:hypothetical protein